VRRSNSDRAILDTAGGGERFLDFAINPRPGRELGRKNGSKKKLEKRGRTLIIDGLNLIGRGFWWVFEV